MQSLNKADISIVNFFRDSTFHVLLVFVYLIFSTIIVGFEISYISMINSYRFLLDTSYIFLVFLMLFFVYKLISHINLGFESFHIIYKQTKTNYISASSLIYFLFIIIAIPVFISSHNIVKTYINQAKNFSYDELFYNIDKAIHFGSSPWEILHPFLSYLPLTKFIDIIYGLGWGISWYFTFIIACFIKDRKLRWTYFSVFFVSWILFGAGLNYLFVSAGPCYYGNVTNCSDPYYELFQYLNFANRNVSINAIGIQSSLWHDYTNTLFTFGAGISAMPSMHLSMMTTCAIFAFNLNKYLGCTYALILLIIFLGSIHLGWHYAVDSYVSILATGALWFAMSKIAKFKFNNIEIAQ